MSLYGERLGALHIVCDDEVIKKKVQSQLNYLIKQEYSSPPIHGAKIAVKMLRDEHFRNLWFNELNQADTRLKQTRKLL